MDRVICWSQAIHILVPRSRAGEDDLSRNTNHAHIAKGSSENWYCFGWSPEEHDNRAHCRCSKVANAVRKPRKKVEDDILMGGEDIAKVCAVEDVL